MPTPPKDDALDGKQNKTNTLTFQQFLMYILRKKRIKERREATRGKAKKDRPDDLT
jgi:hypothetical protein